jgi:hypothetical protein
MEYAAKMGEKGGVPPLVGVTLVTIRNVKTVILAIQNIYVPFMESDGEENKEETSGPISP